jgi:hypothetical protein
MSPMADLGGLIKHWETQIESWKQKMNLIQRQIDERQEIVDSGDGTPFDRSDIKVLQAELVPLHVFIAFREEDIRIAQE